MLSPVEETNESSTMSIIGMVMGSAALFVALFCVAVLLCYIWSSRIKAGTPKEIYRQSVPLEPKSMELMPYDGANQQFFTARSDAVIINKYNMA